MVIEHPTPAEAASLIMAREGFTFEEEYECWLWDATPSSYGPVLAFWECNPPEAPIWMGDFTHRPLGELGPGDVVIGWERGSRRDARLCRSLVQAVGIRKAPLVRVVLESGRELRCTADHKWWRYKTALSGHRKYAAAQVGRELVNIVEPPEPLTTTQARTAGWLGGMYDGEGHRAFISQKEKNPDVRARLVAALDELAIPHGVLTWQGVQITGGFRGLARFAALCQPERYRVLESRLLIAKFGRRDRVVAVEPDGVGEVVSMQTTTGNYVAWGYASKNCVYGELASGLTIYHTCPNGRRGCVRPSHLDVQPDDLPIPEPPLRDAEATNFAKRLRDERDARRMSQARFAKHLGVAESTIKAWEKGGRVPAADLVRELGRRLGWDNKPRKWTVTMVHQRVVRARSAGEACRAVWSDLEVEGEQLKTVVHEVRQT